MAEHSAVNRRVVGSSPTWGADGSQKCDPFFRVCTCVVQLILMRANQLLSIRKQSGRRGAPPRLFENSLCFEYLYSIKVDLINCRYIMRFAHKKTIRS